MSASDCSEPMKRSVFEDINGTVEIASTPKMRLKVKKIAIKHHHFRTCASKGAIKILKAGTHDYEEDFLFNP